MKSIKLKNQKGFTMTELMVGVTIGIIGTLVIFQVLRNSNGLVENVSGGNDANQNGAVGAYVIERNVKSAGFGFNSPDLITCTIKGTRVSGALEQAIGSIKLNPVLIDQGATDAISVSYSSEGSSFIAPTKLTEAYVGDTSNIKVANRFGFNPGGLFIITDGTTCTLRQVQSLPTGGASDNIVHIQGSYLDQYSQSMPIKFNKATGEGVAYPVNSKVYNVGGAPVYNTYSIVNKNLVVTNGITGEQQIVVTDIVDLQAEYGMINGADITWTTTTPVTSADYYNLVAVKYALVARSPTPSLKKDAGGNCNTTTTAPTWSGGTFDLSTNVGTDWKCYRYKVFESSAFLKNLASAWRPS